MSGGVEQALHQWWQATAALTALVPVDRVGGEVLGFNESEDADADGDGWFDSCVVFVINTQPQYRTNSSRGYQSMVTVSCLSRYYDEAKDIAQAILSAWTDQSFTHEQIEISWARPVGQIEVQQDEQTQVWEHKLQLELIHQGV
jgi:hypothetical protein